MVELYMRVSRTVGLACYVLQRIRSIRFTLYRRRRVVHTWIVHSVHPNVMSVRLRSVLDLFVLLRRPNTIELKGDRVYKNARGKTNGVEG